MLDICTCIISFIIFSDLVPDLYFQDTDTWDSGDMHYFDYMTFLDIPCYFILWSRVLVIMLHDSYLSRTSHVHYIHITPCMHGHIAHDLSFWLFLILLLPSVLETDKHIIFLCPIDYYYIFIFSLLLFFFLRVLLLVCFWRTFIIFQYLDQKAGIESWS